MNNSPIQKPKKSIFSRIFLTLLFVAIFDICFSQKQENIETLKPYQLLKTGKNAERVGDIYSAINYYSCYCDKKPEDVPVRFILADLYRKSRNYTTAEIQFEKCYTLDPKGYTVAMYYFALMQKMNDKPEEAKKNFNKFITEYTGFANTSEYKKKALNEILGCDLATQLAATPLNITITHLDTSINKAHVEMSPLPLNDSTLLYASLRSDSIEYTTTDNNADSLPVRKFYLAHKKNEKWKGGEILPGPFNKNGVNTGNGSYSQDGKRFYFSRCNRNWKNKTICALFVSKFENELWLEPTNLGEEINLDKYTSTQPTVGSDSKTGMELIYFVSDMPGGKGGLDIWYTIYDQKKKLYKSPKTAGGKLNTLGDEFSPYYDNDTKTLYFSSDGYPSIGGLDIYKSTGELKTWTLPENIGTPINSCVDDLYYSLEKSKDAGFFVSNRKGGIALLNETCCDDIYEFKFNHYITIALKGNIFEYADTSKLKYFRKDIVESDTAKSIQNLTVLERLVSKTDTIKLIKQAKLFLYLNSTEGNLLLRTDSLNADGEFFFKLEQGNNYQVDVTVVGYFNKKIKISTKNIIKSDTLERAIGVKPITKEPIIIKNIYYPFDKFYLTDEAKIVIDTTIYAILKNNPQLVVELCSHTDWVGSDEYNQKLSQNRAQSVVDYLSNKGIEKERMVAKGYGETKPIAPNQYPNGIDYPDGRQMNRRTEFRVIGELDKFSKVVYLK